MKRKTLKRILCLPKKAYLVKLAHRSTSALDFSFSAGAEQGLDELLSRGLF